MDFRFADRMEGITGNAIREIFALLSRPEIISLAGGNPSPSAFPVEAVSQIAREVLADNGCAILQYGATEGYAPLRESACSFLADAGVAAAPDGLIIVSGGQQGIDLTCKALLNPGDVVLVENPTYLAALHIVKTYQGRAVAVRSDEDGIDLADLEAQIKRHNPKFLYLVPTFQNPTGRTLPLHKRRAVAELTARLGVVVVEDDPYRDLRYTGTALPAVKSFDTAGNVVYLCSFSKVISPGMRVACAVADPALLRKMVIGKQATDVHTNSLGQAVVDQFIRRGLLRPHIASILPGYKRQMDAMMAGFAAFPDWVRHTSPEGGLFVWCEMPRSVDAEELFKQAVNRNVAFVPGTSFFADGDGRHTFRLNFSMNPPERIEKGMAILSGLLREVKP